MKQFNLQQIATIIDGQLHGNGATLIVDADTIRDSRDGYLTFASKKEYFAQLEGCPAAAVLIPENLVDEFREVCSLDFVAVANVIEAFTKIVSLFRLPLPVASPGISPAAHVDPTAALGKDVIIDPGAVIGPSVVLGDRCHVHSGAHLMSGTRVGDDTEIYPNAVLYENTVVGSRCRLHANSVIGCHGFGYESSTGQHFLTTQLGNVEIGDDVDIGAATTIDRATYGSTTIGEGTKIDNLVQIGHNCRIGKRNLLCALTGIAGSCTTGDNVVMAGQVGIGDHTNIGDRVVLGAKSGVMADIAPDSVFVGVPATPAKQQMTIIAATHRLPELRKKVKQMEKELDRLTDLAKSSDNEASSEAA